MMDAGGTLAQLMGTYGPALAEDSRRLEALLRDLAGDDRRGVFVLVSSLRERVAADLQGWPAGVPAALHHARLAARLSANLGLDAEVARWSVEQWGAALATARRGTPPGMPGPDGTAPDSAGPPDAPFAPPAPPPGPEAADDFLPFERDGAQRPTLRVGPDPDEADFATLRDAVRAAEPGTRILVSPGVYTGGVVLDRPVEIVAATVEGNAGAAAGVVVLEAAETSCLVMETGYAVVRGLVLRGRAGPEHRTRFAVDVPHGHLVLEDCDVTSEALACVAIRGRDANPVLRRCQVRDGRGSGVFVQHGGTGTLESCAVVGHALAGVEIGSDGNPTLRHCAVLDGRGPGVYVSLGGAGTLESCVVSGNRGAGVEIGWLGGPVLRRCRVSRNGDVAVRLHAGGGATVEACDLADNPGGAWDIAEGRLRHTGGRSSVIAGSAATGDPAGPAGDPAGGHTLASDGGGRDGGGDDPLPGDPTG